VNIFTHSEQRTLRSRSDESEGSTEATSRMRRPLVALTITVVASYLLVAAWLAAVLEFHFMQSDVAGYWRDSLAWRTPFNPDHVPGYPLLIAFINYLTGGAVEPMILFWTLTLCAHVLGAFAVYSSVALHADNDRAAYLAALLFALWPFVGTTYVVYPISDSIALALIAWGTALLLFQSFLAAALLLGLSCIVHKGTWMFVILLLAAGVITNRRRFPAAAWFVAAGPLGFLWAAGMIVNGYGPFWLLSVSLPIQFAAKSSLPVLDGLLGTLVTGGLNKAVKAVVLWTHVAVLGALALSFFRNRSSCLKWYGLAIVGGLLFLFVGLNQDIIWAAVRYSKIAALPIGFYLATQPRIISAIDARRWIIPVLVVTLLSTQIAYSWYMAEVFSAAK
jgi:hypothetical protein